MNRSLRYVAATTFLLGIVVTVIAGGMHPGTEDPNHHQAVFAEYAASMEWTLVHLGQFIGLALIVLGLLVSNATRASERPVAKYLGWLGAILAAVTLGLYAVLQAIDGVALKQAVDAWVAAPELEKAARFAVAEGVRWLEWGGRSYESLVFGATLGVFGASALLHDRPRRFEGGAMLGGGTAYIVQGLVVGSEGFSHNNSIPTLAAFAFLLLLGAAMSLAAFTPARVASRMPNRG